MARCGQARQAPTWGRTFLSGLALTIALTLTGCSQTPTTAIQKNDPLQGIMTPPGQPQQPNGGTKSASQPLPAAGVSATPTSFTGNNNASLAANWQGPLGRPLKIDEDGRPYAPGQAPQEMPGYPPPNPNPRVEIVPDVSAPPPQKLAPLNEWKSPQMAPPAVIPSEARSQQPSEDQFQQTLQARGVLQQKLSVIPEGVRLTCYVPREGGVRGIEVIAANYPAAVQAMLRELETR